MENSTQTTVLLKALDLELLAILTADLEAFKSLQNVAA
jgi:hypothetical protein